MRCVKVSKTLISFICGALSGDSIMNEFMLREVLLSLLLCIKIFFYIANTR